MIDFTVSDAERVLIDRIVERAVAGGNCGSPIATAMDLCAVQNSSTPLHLQRLLDADDFNLAHDLYGIALHLDRRDSSPTAGELLDCFLPRFALKAQGPLPTDPPWLQRRLQQVADARAKESHK